MPGCPERTAGGPCPAHAHARRQAIDARRGTAASRGYDARWRKARDAWLRSNPLCVHCLAEGRAVEATCVDHIVPHKGDPELFWDRANWQSLCDHHHAVKTASEDGGFGHGRP